MFKKHKKLYTFSERVEKMAIFGYEIMKCIYCDNDNEATKYCDFVIGINTDAKIGEKIFRCDAPICDKHALQIGFIHAKKFTETIDYCPNCYEEYQNKTEPKKMSQNEAEQERIKAHAEIRRSLIKVT